MDEYDDGGFVALTLVPLEVYEYSSGSVTHTQYITTHTQYIDGYLRKVGVEEVNPMMIETIEYVETTLSTFRKSVIPGRWCFGLLNNTRIEWIEEEHPCCYYVHGMVSGRKLITVQPLVPIADHYDREGDGGDIEFDDKVRPFRKPPTPHIGD